MAGLGSRMIVVCSVDSSRCVEEGRWHTAGKEVHYRVGLHVTDPYHSGRLLEVVSSRDA